jgi:hypothetical protein
MNDRVLRFLALSCIAGVFTLTSLSAGSILTHRELKVDFADANDAAAKAYWFPAEKLSITEGGLGWDGDANASRDGWIQTRPISLGYSWRTPFVISVRAEIYPPPPERITSGGRKYTPHAGEIYVRYSPDLKHWSSWQVLQYAEPQSHAEKRRPGKYYKGTIRVPYRERSEYSKLLMEYSRLDVPWKSDQEAAVRWMLRRQPDFFARSLPFIGYVEFLVEGDFRGGHRLESLKIDTSYGMSGLHHAPKDKGIYENHGPWKFRAEDTTKAEQKE